MNANPMTRQAMEANPQLAQQMQNPDFIRQVTNPQNLQAIMQMQQAMQQLQNSGLFPYVLHPHTKWPPPNFKNYLPISFPYKMIVMGKKAPDHEHRIRQNEDRY